MGAVSITIISTSVSTNTWVQGHVTEDDTIFVETASQNLKSETLAWR